jgi:hypothetical protein
MMITMLMRRMMKPGMTMTMMTTTTAVLSVLPPVVDLSVQLTMGACVVSTARGRLQQVVTRTGRGGRSCSAKRYRGDEGRILKELPHPPVGRSEA